MQLAQSILLEKRRKKQDRPWTQAEIQELQRKVKQGQGISTIHIKGRTQPGIYKKAVRLGLVKVTVTCKKWTTHEKELLKYLVSPQGQGLSAIQIKRKGFFPKRSLDSVAQKMRRLHLGREKHRIPAINATRLSGQRLKEFHDFICENNHRLTSAEIAVVFGVSPGTVRNHRRKLGISVSWHQARDKPSCIEKRSAQKERMKQATIARWERYFSNLLAQMEKKKRQLGSEHPSGTKTCSRCQRVWPATKYFFVPTKKRLKSTRRIATYLMCYCHLCRRKQHI